MTIIDHDAAFEEMSPGPAGDSAMVGGGARIPITVPLCKIDGCGHTAGWTTGMYAGLCENHAAAKKAAKANGASKAKPVLPPTLPATVQPLDLAALELQLRGLEESAEVVRELIAAIHAYNVL